MESTRALGRGFRAVVVVVGIAVLAGCAVSPTTTYQDDDGRSVTVSWSDYPARSDIAIDEVLDAVPVEEVDDRWAAMRADLTEAVGAAVGGSELVWTASGEGEWFPLGGNGYGGTSMMEVFNSSTWTAEVTIPRARWLAVLEAAETALNEWGIESNGALEESSPEAVTLARWLDDTFFIGDTGEFLSVTVQDATLEAQAHADAKEYDSLVAGITLFYGVQTISAADREAFIAAAAPFEGLTRPEPSHSD